MNRQHKMISKDKKRKAVISETDDKLFCNITLSSNEFCQVELHSADNYFELSEQNLRDCPYMKFVKHYLVNGIEDKSCYWIQQHLLTKTGVLCCSWTANFQSQTKFLFLNYPNVAMCSTPIGNKRYSADVDPLFRTNYEDVNRLSNEMLLGMLDDWTVVEVYETIEEDWQGLENDNFSAEELYLIRIDDITMFAFNDLIYRLRSGMYLKFVDYYHTHKVLLWDKIPKKIKAKLTKAQLFDKKIVLTSIHADGTPEFMFF